MGLRWKITLWTILWWIWLAKYSYDTSNTIQDTSCKAFSLVDISNKFTLDYTSRIYEYANRCFQDDTERQLFLDTMLNVEFKNKIVSILAFENNWSIEKVTASAILWFLYWFAYMKTIKKVKWWMPIDISSFTTFSLTSWWMVVLNWFLPWSAVYMESFILAWYTVWLHLNNIYLKDNALPKQMVVASNIAYKTLFSKERPKTVFPLEDESKRLKSQPHIKSYEPKTLYATTWESSYVVDLWKIVNVFTYSEPELQDDKRYKPYSYASEYEINNKDKFCQWISMEKYRTLVLMWEIMDREWKSFSYYYKWRPIVVNKTLERISWYSLDDYIKAWENAEEWDKYLAVMKMLYKWENYQKVEDYVVNVWITWWYREAFTMNTAYSTEITLLWTTYPDPWLVWWNMRVWTELKDEEEIRRELAETHRKVEEAKRRMELLEEQNKVLENKANTCKLTWLLNENWFWEFIENYSRELYSVVSLDLDFFKKANDNWWHDFWDLVLKIFWFFLKNSLRDSDISVRPHWDEFFAVLDFCIDENAWVVINSFCELFSSVVFHIWVDWRVSAYYIWDNQKHNNIFKAFVEKNNLNNEIPNWVNIETIKWVIPWNVVIAEDWGKLISFSASCWIKTWNRSDSFQENFKASDLLIMRVKNISKLAEEINLLVNSWELVYETLEDWITILKRVSDWEVLISINSWWKITELDAKNWVVYNIYDDEWNINWLKILKRDKTFIFTKSWLEFYSNITNSDTSAWTRDEKTQKW